MAQLKPTKLGPILPLFTQNNDSNNYNIITKDKYSMFSNEIHKSLQNENINNIILTGVETQWCVSQTAHDLLVNNYNVHIPIDAVSCQSEFENKIAIQRLIEFGIYPCTTHGIICELLKDSNSSEAKWYLQYLKSQKK